MTLPILSIEIEVRQDTFSFIIVFAITPLHDAIPFQTVCNRQSKKTIDRK